MALFAASVVFSTVLMLVPLFLNDMRRDFPVQQQRLFFVQIKQDIHNAKSTSCGSSQLTMEDPDGDQINYAQNGMVIRRQVGGEGYEIVLQGVTALNFVCSDRLVTLKLSAQDGREYVWSVIGYLLQ